MEKLPPKAQAVLSHVSWKRTLIVYSVAVSTIALITVIQLNNANQTARREADQVAAREKKRDSLLALYDKPVINANGDKVLFPEMKLAVPATMVSRTMLYHYLAPTFASGGTTTAEQATFASRDAIIESVKPNGNDNCNILAEVSFGRPLTDAQGLVSAGDVTLAGGRRMFIYQNKSDCTKVWGGLDSGTVILLLRQSSSY